MTTSRTEMGKRGTEKGRAASLGSMQLAALRDGVQTAKKTAGKRERGRSMIFAYGRSRTKGWRGGMFTISV